MSRPDRPGRRTSLRPVDRYGTDVLSTDWRAPRRGRAVEVQADKGLVVEEVTTDWCGEIVRVERDLMTVELEDRRGGRRTFPLGPGVLLEGVDDLSSQLADFRPGPERRAGVLVDHLVPGSKESRIAEAVRRGPLGGHVLVVGHPYVDVWQAVKPE